MNPVSSVLTLIIAWYIHVYGGQCNDLGLAILLKIAKLILACIILYLLLLCPVSPFHRYSHLCGLSAGQTVKPIDLKF